MVDDHLDIQQLSWTLLDIASRGGLRVGLHFLRKCLNGKLPTKTFISLEANGRSFETCSLYVEHCNLDKSVA